jgi:hypothetical protein
MDIGKKGLVWFPDPHRRGCWNLGVKLAPFDDDGLLTSWQYQTHPTFCPLPIALASILFFTFLFLIVTWLFPSDPTTQLSLI